MQTRLFTKITLFVLMHCALCSSYIQAQVSLPAIFSDHMVLQRNSDVPIWGWETASRTVRIIGSWAPQDTIKAVAASDGKWKATLKTTQAGGPFTLQIIGSSNITLQHVMLGEVWLCSGQSNMEWEPYKGILNAKEEAQAADYPNIRFFRVAQRGADAPQENCEGKWQPCTPQSMNVNSAIAYFFSRQLYKTLQIPVGVIVSAWGGTPAEVWTPKEVVEQNSIISANKPTQTYAWWPVETSKLYNQMIHPLIPYRIAGTIWYQGESNQDRYTSYNVLMKELIHSWRKGFGYEFPFYFVQIAPFAYNAKNNTPALLREQQERTMLETPRTAMVVVSDLTNDVKNIHPMNKQGVGLRLANIALVENYSMDIKGYLSPTYDSMQIDKNKIIIRFKNADDGLFCADKVITGLKICGSDGVWQDAQAKIKGNTIIVSAPELKSPTNVSYCFDETTIGNLFSKSQLPVAPFRTDRGF